MPGETEFNRHVNHSFAEAMAASATDRTNVTLAGAVDGTMVLVTYSWKMPRYDLITIDNKGIVRRIKGLAHAWTQSIPKAPNGQLVLAQVFQIGQTIKSQKSRTTQ